MDAVTIHCDICGTRALVHKVRFEYEPGRPAPPGQRVLRETQRDIECPNCGRRTQVERHENDGQA